MHQPFKFLYIDYGKMTTIHIFASFCLSYLLMVRVYYALFRQNYQTVVFSWQDLKELPALFKYYFFLTADKPPERKYNAGQRMIFTAWFIFLSAANLSGAMAFKKDHFMPVAKYLGGLHHLDWATLAAALLLAYTVPLHIYLSFTENNNFLQSMVTGFAYELKPGTPAPRATGQEKNRVRLPGKWLAEKLRSLFT